MKKVNKLKLLVIGVLLLLAAVVYALDQYRVLADTRTVVVTSTPQGLGSFTIGTEVVRVDVRGGDISCFFVTDTTSGTSSTPTANDGIVIEDGEYAYFTHEEAKTLNAVLKTGSSAATAYVTDMTLRSP